MRKFFTAETAHIMALMVEKCLQKW